MSHPGVVVATDDPEIEFLVTYPCGGCQRPLQAPARRVSAWLRCPWCGRGGLPPDQVLQRKRPAPIAPDEDVLRIDPPRELPAMTPVAVAAGGETPAARPTAPDVAALSGSSASRPNSEDAGFDQGHGLRVAYASVLFIALTLLLFSFLDQSMLGTSVCGAVALLALVLLVLSGRRERLD